MLRAIMNEFRQAKLGWSGGPLTNCGTPELWERERRARAAGVTLEGVYGPDARPAIYGTLVKDDMSGWWRAKYHPADPPEGERQGPRDQGD